MIDERRGKGLYWDRAWKLVEGCTKVSPGCDNCWSERETHMRASHPNDKIRERTHSVVRDNPRGFNGSIFLRHDNLDLPLRTKKPTVFAVWNDPFHKDVPDEFIGAIYNVIYECQDHTFLLLTKRHDRVPRFWDMYGLATMENVWHGVTICNRDELYKLEDLRRVIGLKRFVSFEPLLGDIGRVDLTGIRQVVLGGESGPGARPMNPEWVRSVRDQCEKAGVPFYFKQWGEFLFHEDVNGYCFAPHRVGKKKAGRLLDGVKHDELAWDNV